MSNDPRIFAEVKRAAVLTDYIEAAVGGKVVKSGKSVFINPSPCCSHNDCFSIFSPNKDGAEDGYKCHSCGASGDVIKFAAELQGLGMGKGLREVARFAGVEVPDRERPGMAAGGSSGGAPAPRRELSRAEYIAERCTPERDKAVAYLVEERGISHEVASRAALRGAVGWNSYRSLKVAEGEVGHGGPALATIVRTLNPGHVVAVDLRYADPALNGGVKTMSQGEKDGYGWTSDIKRLHAAQTVYFVESAINALSIESAGMHGRTAAFATRGTGNVGNIDFAWMRGKQAIICFDNDEAFPEGHAKAGERPGLSAAWALHERLTAMDVSALLVDQSDWAVNDANDLLKAEGADGLKRALWRLEPWLIPGMAGHEPHSDGVRGKRRVFLPFHHDAAYWRFRVRPEFTSYVSEMKRDPDDPEAAPKIDMKELAGFRVASMSRVTIQSATATMTGDADTMPRTLFSVSVQTARHGAQLIRKVLDDEKLHNIDQWKRFGPVWDQSRFLRMVNILENAADIGARTAANFVGLCWKGGKMVVNEGPDCYFQQPEQQCPYHNLTFPGGPVSDSRRIIEAYQRTFGHSAAALVLVWALGGHLKSALGFWPHMMIQADKGAGKSTLIKRLERTIAFTMFSGQSLQTEFRLLTSVSHTSHPVGWEELSARRQDVIDKAVAILQENYQYTVSRRGSDMLEFLLSAPVLLAGEDVPVKSLIGKIVRSSLRVKGEILPEDLPRFPVKQWLAWLTEMPPTRIRAIYDETHKYVLTQSRATGEDDGAKRMATNYAAVLTAWRLLAEFAEMDVKNEIRADLMAEMNAHIKETSSDREPWVWIMEQLAGELGAGEYKSPWKIEAKEDDEILFLRTSDVMHHLQRTTALRDFWNALPVKSDRVFKRQMKNAGVIIGEMERTVGGKRVPRMTAISLQALEGYGVFVHRPEAVETGVWN